MAQSYVQLATDGTGKKMDTQVTASASQHRQVMAIGDPSTDANVAGVTAANALKVDLSGTGANATAIKVDGSAVTQPVSAASLPLPSGAATAAKQPALGTAGASSTDVISVQGIASGTALPVSAASLPLPSGASTAAKQPALGSAGSASSDVLTVQGVASMTALKVDGSAVTQPVSLASTTVTGNVAATNAGTFAVQNSAATPAGTNLMGKVGIDQTTPGTTNGVQVNAALPAGTAVIGKVTTDQTTHGTTDLVAADLTKVAGTAIVNGGLAGSVSIGGTGAASAAITQNPLNLGAKGVSSEATAVTTGQLAQLVTDLVGKLIVLPYANPENFVSGVTAAMTATTSTSLIAAPAAGLRNYVTHLIVTNSHATVGTFVNVQDGSGGTTIYSGYAAPAGGGFSITFPTPLRQPTLATALYCVNATTGANTVVSASGFIGR